MIVTYKKNYVYIQLAIKDTWLLNDPRIHDAYRVNTKFRNVENFEKFKKSFFTQLIILFFL